MKSIVNLFEGFFDIEDNVAKFDSNINKDWLEKNAAGKFKCQILKSGDMKVNGTIIIKGFDGDTLPALNIISVINGDVTIEKCPNLTTIDGLFGEGAKIQGNLNINNNPKLISIKGCPRVIGGSLSIMGNSSLKSLEGMPWMMDGACYVMKNGRKFKEDEIVKDLIGARKIMCSMEDRVEMINEALNEPHLLELETQLKKQKLGFNFKDIMFPKSFYKQRQDKFYLNWDEIDSSQVRDYARINDNVIKDIRRILSATGVYGFVLLRDTDDEYFAIITSSKQIIFIKQPTKYSNYELGRWRDWSYSQIMPMIGNAYSCVIIQYEMEDRNNHAYKRVQRQNSREGMIENTPEQNKQIAKENRARYEKLIAQIRANRNTNVDKYADKIDDIMMRYLKCLRDYSKPDTKIRNWEMSSLNELIGDRRHWFKGHSSGDNGLLYYYEEYISNLKTLQNGETEYVKSRQEALKTYEESLNYMIQKIDNVLKKFGF